MSLQERELYLSSNVTKGSTLALYDQREDEHGCMLSNFSYVNKGPLWPYCGLLLRKYVISVLRQIFN